MTLQNAVCGDARLPTFHLGGGGGLSYVLAVNLVFVSGAVVLFGLLVCVLTVRKLTVPVDLLPIKLTLMFSIVVPLSFASPLGLMF